MKCAPILIALSVREATPHRRLHAVLEAGDHISSLIAWALAAIVVGLVLAAFI